MATNGTSKNGEGGLKGKRKQFLALYPKVRSITVAADGVGVHRRTIYKWRDTCKEFAEAFAEAREQIADELEAKALERAITGDPEDRGSHVLMIFLLKGLRREVYGDHRELRHEGSGGGPIIIERRVPRPNYDDDTNADSR